MKSLKIFIITLVLAFAAAGCATLGQNPQQKVFQAEQNYKVALRIAVAYKALPTCVTGSTALCSKPGVVADLQKVDIAAFALLKAAENTVRTEGAGANVQTAVTAANQAVMALTTITNALTVK